MHITKILGALFAPPFVVIDLKRTIIKIQDGAGTPNAIEVTIGEGNLTYDENRNVEYILDRGQLDEVRLGDEVPMDVSFDFIWEYIEGNTTTSGNLPTVEDALKKINNAASWTSTDSDQCRPYAVDIIIQHIPECDNGDQEFTTLPDFRQDTLSHDMRAGSISCTGRCNATQATHVRNAQSTGSPNP